jgi:MFS family permease
MGREEKHLIGLSRSTISIAYIVGPVLAGFIASQVGERMTFSVVGTVVIVVAIFLLLTTPRKLKLPQEEIAKWDK